LCILLSFLFSSLSTPQNPCCLSVAASYLSGV
jgi:hypothetical protein